MARKNNKHSLTQRKRNAIRRIVILSMRIARRDLSADFVEFITTQIVASLPKTHMRRLVEGDLGRPMLAAMKRTTPFLRTIPTD
jgi:hypothetical protein